MEYLIFKKFKFLQKYIITVHKHFFTSNSLINCCKMQLPKKDNVKIYY